MKSIAFSLFLVAAHSFVLADQDLPDHATKVIGNDAYVFPAVETRFIDSSRVIAVGRYEAAIVDVHTGAVTRLTEKLDQPNSERIVAQSVIGGSRYLVTPVYSADETLFVIRDLTATEPSATKRVTCEDRIREFGLSDDGKCLAIYHPRRQSIELYATQTGELLDRQVVPLSGRPVTQLQFVNQGNAILFRQKSPTGEGIRVYVHDYTANREFGNEIASFDSPRFLRRIVPTAAQNSVLFWDGSREITLFDFMSASTVAAVELPVSPTFANLSSDKKKLVTCGASNWFQLWDISDPQQPVVAREIDAGSRPRSVALSADNSTIVASVAGRVRFWDTKTGDELHAPDNQATGPIAAIAISPDQTKVATADHRGRCQLWDLRTGKPIRLLDKKRGRIGQDPWVGPQFLRFSTDGTKVLGGSSDAHNVVNLWDASTGGVIRSFAGHRWPIMGVAWSPDGEIVASTSRDKTMRVIDMRGNLLHTFEDATMSPVFFPSGDKIIASGNYGSCRQLKVFDLKKGRRSLTLFKAGSPTRVGGTAISTDGKQVAASFQGGQVQAWNTKNGELIFDVKLGAWHPHRFGSVAFSHNGQTLAAAVGTNSVFLLDPKTGQVKHELLGHRGPVIALAAGKDLLVSAGDDHRVIVWQIPK